MQRALVQLPRTDIRVQNRKQEPRDWNMNQNELRQTAFDVVPLRNVVGIGRAAAFQIRVQHGRVLATPLLSNELARSAAANDAPDATATPASHLRSLLRRLTRR